MTNSKMWQLAIALVLTCNLSLRAAEEPNDPNNSQIKIEISDEQKTWRRAHTMQKQEDRWIPTYAKASIRPTHVAEGYVQIRDVPRIKAESILKTSAGAGMTTKQREFMEQEDKQRQDDYVYIGPNTGQKYFSLYAVSEDDARKMVEALLEILKEKPRQVRFEYVDKLREWQEEMAKAKGLLPGKEALLLTVKAKYDKSKEYAHAFSADTEAAEQAKQTIVEMGKMLDTLDVELAGIREKLKVINDYWSKRGEMSEAARGKLQEMEIEQMVELKGAEARRKAAVGIRQREKDFLDLFDQWTSLDSEVKHLKSTIESREKRIAEIEETLANPKPDMLPPKIYQDKVVIYPVSTE
jgi:hypothetical protein